MSVSLSICEKSLYRNPFLSFIMRTFESYFSKNEILKLICKVRVKLAKNKSKRHLLHLLTSNPAFNYHVKLNSEPKNEFEVSQKELTDFLLLILPPRKKWLKLGEHSRRKPNCENEFLSSNDKNYYSLLKTIKAEKKKDYKSRLVPQFRKIYCRSNGCFPRQRI